MRLEKLTLEEYLKYFDVGVPDYVISAVYDISPSTLKNYKRRWGFSAVDAQERRIMLYKKWRDKGFSDRDIAKLMGRSPSIIHNLKSKCGLTQGRGWNAKTAQKGISVTGARPLYYHYGRN